MSIYFTYEEQTLYYKLYSVCESNLSMNIILQAQLERFILFMVHCSLGHDTTKVINKPEWWPQDIKFSSPLTRPKKINDVSNHQI